MRTKVQKWGNSLAIRIPKVFADQLGVEHGYEVDLVLEDNRLVVKVVPERYSLGDLLSLARRQFTNRDLDWQT